MFGDLFVVLVLFCLVLIVDLVFRVFVGCNCLVLAGLACCLTFALFVRLLFAFSVLFVINLLF